MLKSICTFLKKLIMWLKLSFEGNDGKASSRKLTTFVFALTTIVLIYADLFYNLTIDPILLTGVLSMTAISLGLVTAQNIVDILKRPQSSYFNNDVYNTQRKVEEGPEE